MALGKFIDSLSIKAGILAVLALGGCIATTFPYMRTETAQRIAAPAWMIKRDIDAGAYVLRAYERIHERGGVANLYIEGDGSAFTSPRAWVNNPTPRNPVALHLASKDAADNLIYIARPCQYTVINAKDRVCAQGAWKNKRFSPDVLTAFEAALDDIARRYDIRGFHLIGYSGGGAIAALLAAQRKDILSFRTVAGILDHETQTALLDVPPLDGSLNPVSEAGKLAKMPQYHFAGGQDRYVPPAILHSYLQAMPPSRCVRTMLVQEAGHDNGWVDKWPELLKLPVTCDNNDAFADFGETTPPAPPRHPAFIMREKPAKP